MPLNANARTTRRKLTEFRMHDLTAGMADPGGRADGKDRQRERQSHPMARRCKPAMLSPERTQGAEPGEVKNIHQGFRPFFMVRQPAVAVSVCDHPDVLVPLLPKIGRQSGPNSHENNPYQSPFRELFGMPQARPDQ